MIQIIYLGYIFARLVYRTRQTRATNKVDKYSPYPYMSKKQRKNTNIHLDDLNIDEEV